MGIAQIAIAPPPLHSNGHSGALYFRTDLSKCHLNFNFHCTSAPNHPGKGSDPPNQANAPLNMDNSSQNKCPKPFGQGSRPPPPFGQCLNRPCVFFSGASLISTSNQNVSTPNMTTSQESTLPAALFVDLNHDIYHDNSS